MDGDFFSIIFENKSNMLDNTALRREKEGDHVKERERIGTHHLKNISEVTSPHEGSPDPSLPPQASGGCLPQIVNCAMLVSLCLY